MPRHVGLVVLLTCVIACGGTQPAGSTATPDCASVAAHLVELAERDNAAEASTSLAANLAAELDRNCRDQAWSSERRTCLHQADNQEATLDCPRK